MLTFVLFSSLALAALAPCTAIQLVHTGFTDEEADALLARARDAVNGQGGPVCSVEALTASLDCLADTRCARETVRAAGARALLVMDLTRAAGTVQLTATVIGPDGRTEASVDDSRSLADARSARIVPAEALEALQRIHQRAAEPAQRDTPKPPKPTPVVAAPPVVVPPPLDPEPATPAAQPTAASTDVPPLLAIGGVVLGAGILVTAVGTLVALSELAVIRDAGSAGADKERAAVLVPVMATVGVLGLASATAGGVLLWWALDGGSDP